MSRRGILLGALLVALLAVGAILSVPQGTNDGPGGTLALERFLKGMGVDVRSGETPPERGTFFLLHDLREASEAGALLSWVSGGGRLVVAQPDSEVLAAAGVTPSSPIGSRAPEVLRPGCVAPEAAGVEALAVDPREAGFSDLPPRAVGCFPGPSGEPFLVVVPRGSGEVVGLGGPSPLTNELLAAQKNAAWVLRLFPGDGPVVFGPPLPAGMGEGRGLWGSLPAGAKAVAAVLMLAALLFAAARGRRLGRPVDEEPLTVIPASQLAHAAANLYRNARATGHAGGLLRGAAAWRLARRLGLPSADPGSVGDALARDGLPYGPEVLGGSGPRDDDELVALGEQVARLEAAAVRDLR
jgi:uncharacterized protein DUF4350